VVTIVDRPSRQPGYGSDGGVRLYAPRGIALSGTVRCS
jgi:hypothetical protein